MKNLHPNGHHIKMKNLSKKIITDKAVFVFILCILLFISCRSSSVKSQTETENPTRSNTKNMSDKIKSLDSFKWKNRIILVRETEEKSLTQLREKAEEIIDRDIIWFRLKDKKIETNFEGDLAENFAGYLTQNYFEKFEKNAILIGKDGGIKSKDDKLNLQDYFGQIDSMPMRRREMREN